MDARSTEKPDTAVQHSRDHVDELLRLVAGGKHGEITIFLTHLMDTDQVKFDSGKVIFAKRPFKDHAGHTWDYISPAIYAAWAGDIFILDTLLSFAWDIPGSFTLWDFKTDCSIVESDKTNGPILGPVLKLIEAYRLYLANENTWNDEEKEKQFIEIVGVAQAKLSLYVLYEICGAENFFPRPPFKREPNRECLFEDGGKLIPFNPQDLGKTFALSRSIWKAATRGPRWVIDDFETIIHFYNTRIRDLWLTIGDRKLLEASLSTSKSQEYDRKDFIKVAHLIGMKGYSREEIEDEVDYEKEFGWLNDTYEAKERLHSIVSSISRQFLHLKLPKSFTADQVKELVRFHQTVREYFYRYADKYKVLKLNLSVTDNAQKFAQFQMIKIEEYERIITAKQRIENRNRIFQKFNSSSTGPGEEPQKVPSLR